MTRSITIPALAAAAALVAAACGSSGGGGGTTQPSPGVLQVGGQYQIVQQAVSDTCGQTGQPATVTATVTHTAGANTFTMTDTGGTRFTGTVQNNGDLAANAVFGPDGGGQTYTQTLQGRFTANGFTAALAVRVTPQNCDFTRNWTATKQGAANIFP
jgi:hypothetical protein